jgi:hypothetical protein
MLAFLVLLKDGENLRLFSLTFVLGCLRGTRPAMLEDVDKAFFPVGEKLPDFDALGLDCGSNCCCLFEIVVAPCCAHGDCIVLGVESIHE